MRSTTTGIIYGLIDPRNGCLRYIGQTTLALKDRLWGHCYEPRRSRKNNWIKSLKSRGLRPIIKALSEHPIEELDDAEIAAIAAIQSTGATLLNATYGGKAFGDFLPYVRVDIANKLRGRVPTEEEKKKRAERARKSRIIQLLNNYAYNRSWGYAKLADKCLEVMERHYGVKYSDPFAQQVLDKIRSDGVTSTTFEHTVGSDEWKTHKFIYTYGLEKPCKDR
jgi:hypothetical protein